MRALILSRFYDLLIPKVPKKTEMNTRGRGDLSTATGEREWVVCRGEEEEASGSGNRRRGLERKRKTNEHAINKQKQQKRNSLRM